VTLVAPQGSARRREAYRGQADSDSYAPSSRCSITTGSPSRKRGKTRSSPPEVPGDSQWGDVMASEEGTRRANRTPASPRDHAASPSDDQEPILKTSPPWAIYIAWIAIAAVSIAALLSVILYRDVLTKATDVATIMIGWFVVVGTIVVAYFTTKTSDDETYVWQHLIGAATKGIQRALAAAERPIQLTLDAAKAASKPGCQKVREYLETLAEPPNTERSSTYKNAPARGGEAGNPNGSTPAGSSQGPAETTINIVNNFREKVVNRAIETAADSASIAIAPVLAAVAGFVGALIPLAYPAGLLTLWIQLSHSFGYGFYKGLYAASLAPSAMVVGKVIWILWFSLFSALIPMWLWYAYARAKVSKSLDETAASPSLRWFRLLVVGVFGLYVSGLFALLPMSALIRNSFLFWPLIILIALVVIFGVFAVINEIKRRNASRTFDVGLVLVLVGSVAAGSFLVRSLNKLTHVDASFGHRADSPFIQAFFWFTMAEVLGGAVLFYRGIRQGKPPDEDKRRDEDLRRDARKAALTSLYLGLAVVYVGSVAAGVCLAGRQNPSLPTVTLAVKHSRVTEVKAGLLSNANAYWYVVDYCNKEKANRLLAIPNTSVEEADAIVEEPVTKSSGRAKVKCPPETTIESGPSGTVASTDARFHFTGHDNRTAVDALKFECRMDESEYKFCDSPKEYSISKRNYLKNPNKEHTLSVRAKDKAGNLDATPARRTWSVDITGPDTTIESEPSETIASRNASFSYSSPEREVTYECKLDKADYKYCASSQDYSALPEGSHTFRVRAKDALGNVDASPRSRTFAVDTRSPETTIKSGPSHTVSSTDAKFRFTSHEMRSTFECSIDGEDYKPCARPKDYSGLPEGDHTFFVRAIDAVGNVDDTPAQRTWTIC
jgi:hypothetical protein